MFCLDNLQPSLVWKYNILQWSDWLSLLVLICLIPTDSWLIESKENAYAIYIKIWKTKKCKFKKTVIGKNLGDHNLYQTMAYAILFRMLRTQFQVLLMFLKCDQRWILLKCKTFRIFGQVFVLVFNTGLDLVKCTLTSIATDNWWVLGKKCPQCTKLLI